MSTIQEQLYTALSGLAGGQIYPLLAPQTVTAPFVVYTRISGTEENTLASGQPIQNTRLQIDSYDVSYANVQALADAVKAAVMGMSGNPLPITAATDLYEAEVKLFRVTQDFGFWHY